MYTRAMSRREHEVSLPSRWLQGIERYDHRLTAEQPIWSSAGDFEPGPTPLEVHCHRALGIGFALDPGLELWYEGLTLRPQRGDVWLDGMWEPHGWRLLTGRCHTVVAAFLPDTVEPSWPGALPLLDMFLAAPQDRPRVSSDEMRRAMLGIADRIARESAERRAGWLEAVRLLLIQALIDLYREWETPRHLERGSAARADCLARVMPALRLANEQVHRIVSAEEAASACGFSPWWFHRLFRRATGMTFARFGTRARLGYAAHLLLSSDMTVAAVAAAAGFADGSHFHRRFPESYGCTPGEYRARHGDFGTQPALSAEGEEGFEEETAASRGSRRRRKASAGAQTRDARPSPRAPDTGVSRA